MMMLPDGTKFFHAQLVDAQLISFQVYVFTLWKAQTCSVFEDLTSPNSNIKNIKNTLLFVFCKRKMTGVFYSYKDDVENRK